MTEKYFVRNGKQLVYFVAHAERFLSQSWSDVGRILMHAENDLYYETTFSVFTKFVFQKTECSYELVK